MNTLAQKNNVTSNPELIFRKIKKEIQARLTITRPWDVYEQEADANAERVMSMSLPITQPGHTTGLIGASVQRKCYKCKEEDEKKRLLMSKTENGHPGNRVSPFLVSSLQATRTGGSPLPANTRNFMEGAFSADFSGVRIHTDSRASEMNREINARAFTYGNDIYFRDGEYQPEKESGKRLLAHELTHVLQQSVFSDSIRCDLAVEPPNPDAAEPVLTGQQIQDAITFNTRRFQLRDPWEISLIRDVLGLPEQPAIVDEDLVMAIARYQAENNITADGKIGSVTAARLSRELFEEGRGLPAAQSRELMRSSRRMGTRSMRINVNQPARTLNNRGSALYGVMWVIPDSAANGFVIQHVRITGNIRDCSGNPAAFRGFEGNRDYWEVWQVINGRVQCGTLAGSCTGSDDTFRTATQDANTRGTVTERGQVSYFPDYMLDPAWITGVVHPAGDLPHRATQPPFWNEGETMVHQMIITYDTCVAPVTSGVTSTP